MIRVAILGIGGFSGRHFERMVAEQNLAQGAQFFGFDRDLSRAERSGLVTYVEGDALDARDLTGFMDMVQPTHVISLLGLFRGSFELLLAVNVGVSRATCEAALRLKQAVQKIVLVGSAAEYGDVSENPVREDAPLRPVSPYGLAKVYQTLLAEYYTHNYALPIVVARTFNILGEGLSAELSIGNFMRQIAALEDGGVLKAGNLTTSRDFLHAAEVSRRYWTLLMKGVAGEMYNVCAGAPTPIRSILNDLIRQSGKKITIETDPALFKERDIPYIYGDGSKFDRLAR